MDSGLTCFSCDAWFIVITNNNGVDLSSGARGKKRRPD